MTNINENIFIHINKNIYHRSICTNIILLYCIIFVFLISSFDPIRLNDSFPAHLNLESFSIR